MKNTKSMIRMIVDISMTILFIILMGYYITGSMVHEILGAITFVLFIVHHILNIGWYKNLFKGKYNAMRIFQVALNFLLLIAMIGMMISGVMISGHVFDFLNIRTTMFGRNLHMISTAWGFVLMSIHVGMHIAGMMNKLNKKMQDTVFEYIYYAVLFIMIALGIYSFVALRLWEEMFLLVHFKEYNYEEPGIVFYLKILILMNALALLMYFILKIKNKLKSNKQDSKKVKDTKEIGKNTETEKSEAKQN